MFYILARYRGHKRRKAEIVRDSADAFSRLVSSEHIEIVGLDEFTLQVADAETAVGVVMALLAPGEWAIALSYLPGRVAGFSDDATASEAATSSPQLELCRRTLGKQPSAGKVSVRFLADTGNWANDIHASFELIGFVLQKRSAEGREATALVRSGLSQIEAASALGISKQAMSQRLQAAGWRAEQAGYAQAISLLARAQRDLEQ